MKSLTILALVVLLAATVSAQEYGDYGGTMGVYFSPTEFTEETANLVTPPNNFYLYIVLLDSQVDAMGGYECMIEMSDPGVVLMDTSGPSGWTNYGSFANHLVGYVDPLPAPASGVVLSTITAFYGGTDPVDIVMGPSVPSSAGPHNPYGLIWEGPIIAGFYDYDILLVCHLSSGAAGYPDVVAWLNRETVAVESHTWTDVKNLFE